MLEITINCYFHFRSRDKMHREAISIKGTKNGLVILLDSNQEFESIKHHLQRKMESANGFFRGATVTFHTGSQKLFPQQKHELEAICKQHGLIPNVSELNPETEALFSPPPTGNNLDTPGEPALLLRQTLRSGQLVSRPNHVVILGNVHPGAKVEAGGNVIIMGSCLGSVHAGIRGNRDASIVAVHLAPQVLRIADVTHTEPPVLKAAPGPNKAVVRDGKIVFLAT